MPNRYFYVNADLSRFLLEAAERQGLRLSDFCRQAAIVRAEYILGKPAPKIGEWGGHNRGKTSGSRRV
jgi:hypothetical protein